MPGFIFAGGKPGRPGKPAVCSYKQMSLVAELKDSNIFIIYFNFYVNVEIQRILLYNNNQYVFH